MQKSSAYPLFSNNVIPKLSHLNNCCQDVMILGTYFNAKQYADAISHTGVCVHKSYITKI